MLRIMIIERYMKKSHTITRFFLSTWVFIEYITYRLYVSIVRNIYTSV